jgi:acyl-lipid omega-6 desaturase (Delta-12 desaturase)
MRINRLFEELKSVKLSSVRGVISKACYRMVPSKAVFWYVFDLCFFAIGFGMIFALHSPWLKLCGGLISGIATAMMFVWAHDAAHGTLFKNKKVAEIMGTIFMFPALSVYRLWIYGHNKVHHGFTSFSPVDWIWRPLSPSEYKEKSRLQRLLYRVERHLLTSAFHYFRRVWWQAMVRYNPAKNAEERRGYNMGKLMVLAYFIGMSALAYFFAGGLLGVLCAVILPFVVFTYFIAMIVYLHHTHPDIPFFDLKKDWSHSIGLLYCSTIIRTSKLAEMFLHNIMIHTPHHVDIRIPFYNLKKAYADLKETYGDYILEYRFSWPRVARIFKKCKLYDFEEKKWLTFAEAQAWLEEKSLVEQPA